MPTFDIDWSAPESNIPKGLHLAEVAAAEIKTAKKSGDKYLNLKLNNARDGHFLCYDICMLTGDQRWSGHNKLEALGFDRHANQQSTEALIGRRVWVYITSRLWNDQMQACVDNKAKGSKSGFYPEGEKPEQPFYESIPESTSPKTTKEDDGEVPF